MTDSIAEVLAYLDHVDPDAAASWHASVMVALHHGSTTPPAMAVPPCRWAMRNASMMSCSQLTHLLEQKLEYAAADGTYFLDACRMRG